MRRLNWRWIVAMTAVACVVFGVMAVTSFGKSGPRRPTVDQIYRAYPVLKRVATVPSGRLSTAELRRLPLGSAFRFGDAKPFALFLGGSSPTGIGRDSVVTLVYRGRDGIAVAAVSGSAGLCFFGSPEGSSWCQQYPMIESVGFQSWRRGPGTRTLTMLIPMGVHRVTVMWHDGRTRRIEPHHGIASLTASRPFAMGFQAANGTWPQIFTTNANDFPTFTPLPVVNP